LFTAVDSARKMAEFSRRVVIGADRKQDRRQSRMMRGRKTARLGDKMERKPARCGAHLS